jgi:hypothetical protein
MPSNPTTHAGSRAGPVLALLAAAAVGACAPPPSSGSPPAPPSAAAQELARSLEQRTSLNEPIRVVFGWQLNEAGTHLKGRGVARIEPPYKARLDLFLDNGETAVRAALVNGSLRLPAGTRTDILPPPDLMWGVLGVFRPDTDTELVGAERLKGGALRLRYRYEDGQELDYRVADGRVRAVELRDRGGHVAQRVELGLDSSNRYPMKATYRNLSAFRELRVTRESVERVDPYPPDIWDPRGTER